MRTGARPSTALEGTTMKNVERLSGLPGQFEKLTRLIGDFVGRGHRIEAKLERLEWVETRLERLEPQLARLVQGTEAKLADLIHQTREVQALGQRLDSDVVRGFAAVAERLDNDVTWLKENAQEHTRAVDQIVDQLNGLSLQVRRSAQPQAQDHPGAPSAAPGRSGDTRTPAQPNAGLSPPVSAGPTARRMNAEADGMAGFNLNVSRNYWRLAPSGLGKHDTTELRNMPADELEGLWNEAYAARMRVYPEEAEFLKAIAPELDGKRILSIGSGLGLLEIFLQSRGATLTCADIVDSNLAVIQKVSAEKNGHAISTILIEDAEQDFGGPYDVVLIYGSLMTMPEPMQRSLLRRCRAALVPQARMILMLYTWEFARVTRGWTAKEEFDPKAFALASDPTVGEEDCPWSDWHDDEKLLALTDGQLGIRRRQFFNQGWYVWYELGDVGAGQPPSLFFDPDVLTQGNVLEEIALVRGTIAHAQAGVHLATTATDSEYLWVDMARRRSKLNERANTVLVEVDLQEGALSVGVLDLDRQAFAFSQAVWQPGRHTHVFTIDEIPARFSVVVSNFPQHGSGRSSFVLKRIALLDRPDAIPSLPGLERPNRTRQRAA